MQDLQTKSRRLNVTYSPTVRVAIGDYYFPFLTLVHLEDEDKTLFCLHEKACFPDSKYIKQYLATEQSSFILKDKLSFKEVECHKVRSALLNAIHQQERQASSHINPFSFLIGYCLACDIDLYELGFFTKN